MGSAAAWRLASRGVRVTGLDARQPPHAFGSTHGHSRIIREAYFEHPQYVPLVQQSYRLWADLEQEARTRLFQATGGLMIGPPDGLLVSGVTASASAHRLPVERWSAADVRRRVPVLAPTDEMVAILEPRAGVLAPERAVSAMLQGARERGATLRFDETVREWSETADGVRVVTTRETLVADRLVLAAGPWLSSLLADLALPLHVERAVQFWYDTGGESRYGPRELPVFILERSDGRLLYGLPDQGRGLKLAEHHGGATADPDGVDRAVSEEERRAFDAFARQFVQLPAAPPSDAAVCLYTNTPDGDFVLDWHPSSERVYIVSACSGHGFKFAPAIGEAVASEIAGGAAITDLTPFRLARLEASRG